MKVFEQEIIKFLLPNINKLKNESLGLRNNKQFYELILINKNESLGFGNNKNFYNLIIINKKMKVQVQKIIKIVTG